MRGTIQQAARRPREMPSLCIQNFVQDKAPCDKNNQGKVSSLQNAKFELSLNLGFKDSGIAQAIGSSVLPEIIPGRNTRSETIVKIKNSLILIGITALDKTALKASLNSCLKSIILAEEILEVK
jgi:KEOPS complex subunit Pcc1